ncbi:pyridoxal 5'-phosphate synthase glutaminase subunit PdxT [Deinococcus arenicola]|uniref:Pyridoxal 5'-phosphate synthase subunit PdxT n=1 Tax=Deinococcus arenicola TaxID=2994950 RepID=A0ABU4DNL0_9DEIO|nr:pyridoxal 5'-phosphate synthase glutaminase subunit PdxT [Deinococcus sp. ZS9-10]MDV6374021.1 pyridoxal 5'-phosphate synthase glutaminase subunit PdxT [Deinococcus sp. ZS9-10]
MAGKPPAIQPPRIGVLALQGAFREHRRLLESLGSTVQEVRLPADLAGLDGLILPGGESTTMAHLLTEYGLWEPIRGFSAGGGAIWGTCAGAILLAREVRGAPPQFGGRQDSLYLLDATVQRNAFGRQINSFAAPLPVQGLDTPFPAVFIRAPAFSEVGAAAAVLAHWEGQAVMLRQGNILATAFHPELTNDSRLHEFFLKMAVKSPESVQI